MKQYLDLLQKILDEGEDVQSGAVIKSEDRKPVCRTLFGQQLRFDLRDGFPIVTTKPVPFDTVVDEVLWFLRGETNIGTLGRVGPDGEFIRRKIWDQWADADGLVTAAYGATWRHWLYPRHDDGSPAWQSTDNPVGFGKAIDRRPGHCDQVTNVLCDLRAVAANPADRARRRILLTGWSPPLVPIMGLAPCHTLSQWLPVNGHLDVVCHWRSIDMYTGAPFNVVQYALLAHVFGGLTGLKPRHFVANVADCHLYDNQYRQVRDQLTREPRDLPTLQIDPRFFETCPDLAIEQICNIDPAWFSLVGYRPHDKQPGGHRPEVAV